VAAQIVEHDNVAGAKLGRENLGDIGEEAGAVDRPVDDEGRDDSVLLLA